MIVFTPIPSLVFILAEEANIMCTRYFQTIECYNLLILFAYLTLIKINMQNVFLYNAHS